MKRPEKMALLAKLLQGGIDQATLRRLYKPDLKPLIIVYEPHCHSLKPTDEVTVKEESKNVTMPYSELDDYARRVGGIVVVMLPDNNRDMKQE